MTTDSRIFVFGSNLAGHHGGGAARFALRERGAEYGNSKGPQGQSYAIPTLGRDFEQLPLEEIRFYVRKEFLMYAGWMPHLRFQVTPIGTGIAGFTHEQIAPMFEGAPLNCDLPEEWAKFDLQKGQKRAAVHG